MQSLISAPESFSSTYAREVAFEPSVWEDRLRNPLAHTFVALSEEFRSPGDTQKAISLADIQDETVMLLTGRWVGMIVIMGPKEESFVQANKSPWQTVGSSLEKSDGDSSQPAILYYHMNAMFTEPAYRGQGIGLSLIEQAYSFATKQSREKGTARMRCNILVDKINSAASKLYQKSGFNAIAEETMASPRKERVDGTTIPEHNIQVLTMERWTTH